MLSQFVEIKASLFKKVDVNHLYQIACSDVKERFHYVILLSVVCIRNMNENSWDTGTTSILLIIPQSYQKIIKEDYYKEEMLSLSD